MKRTSVALGILGLVWAAALAPASAGVLFKADFSTSPFKGFNGVPPYVQGFGGLQRSDPTVPPFFVRDGVLTSSPPDSTAGSDGVSGTDDGVRFLLLTGDPSWADVAIQSHITIDAQNIGSVALVLRAARKTKPADPDTWYEFRYTTGDPNPPGPGEEASGITAPMGNPNVRIMKVIKGKWTLLTETDNDTQSKVHIPAINAAGDDNATGAIFRFVAKGDLLQGFSSIDGKTFTKVLEAHDSELKAGVIGVNHYDYNPQFHDLLVEDAP